ncbi:hypothetical protein [Rhodococcoides fascians]|uniref:hypothetical protein n=1 Tax=Rhodococcoides fascians TaxID=1828 RepID=UPI00378FC017
MMTQELDAVKATTTWPNPFLDKHIYPDWSNTYERKQIEMLFGTGDRSDFTLDSLPAQRTGWYRP